MTAAEVDLLPLFLCALLSKASRLLSGFSGLVQRRIVSLLHLCCVAKMQH